MGFILSPGCCYIFPRCILPTSHPRYPHDWGHVRVILGKWQYYPQAYSEVGFSVRFQVTPNSFHSFYKLHCLALIIILNNHRLTSRMKKPDCCLYGSMSRKWSTVKNSSSTFAESEKVFANNAMIKRHLHKRISGDHNASPNPLVVISNDSKSAPRDDKTYLLRGFVFKLKKTPTSRKLLPPILQDAVMPIEDCRIFMIRELMGHLIRIQRMWPNT